MAATAKKKTTKRTTKKAVVQRSFVRSPETMPFMTFKATHQTAYWLIISLLLLAIGIWVVSLTMRVHMLYDTVEQQSTSDNLVKPAKK